jgi:hypothetical protein
MIQQLPNACNFKHAQNKLVAKFQLSRCKYYTQQQINPEHSEIKNKWNM